MVLYVDYNVPEQHATPLFWVETLVSTYKTTRRHNPEIPQSEELPQRKSEDIRTDVHIGMHPRRLRHSGYYYSKRKSLLPNSASRVQIMRQQSTPFLQTASQLTLAQKNTPSSTENGKRQRPDILVYRQQANVATHPRANSVHMEHTAPVRWGLL
jgi:hypothetical protein